MRHAWLELPWLAAWLITVGLTTADGLAAGPAAPNPSTDPVRVRYALSPESTTIVPLVSGTAYFIDDKMPIGQVPAEGEKGVITDFGAKKGSSLILATRISDDPFSALEAYILGML